ncbi:tetratricopeptide repeat protein [Spirosoma sp. KNUC1025]|uniref:tetratricopeptide repeat protein n=1 Tax=Spirosoma sp. KNUC1025 TaxID=2894082 RepID=UPI00386CF1FF|nr:hypothetical protein LN737_07350 [Spirosoma sp. KNUC1025]
MRQLLCLYLLIPCSVIAQDGERFITSTASMLAVNRSEHKLFFSPIRRPFKIDPLSTNVQNHRSRAFHYVWQHDYEQAAIWLEKLSTEYPKEHGMVGEIYLSQLRDYPRALRHLDAYDALTPLFNDMINNNPVSYLRGLTYRALENNAQAVEQFSVGIDSLAMKHGAEWVNYRHYVSRATSYIALQQPEKALIDLDHAIKNFNQSALAQYHRGRALLQLNRVAEAQTAFQDASFFFKALRAERTGEYQEDNFNPLYEAEIDEALANLKKQKR